MIKQVRVAGVVAMLLLASNAQAEKWEKLNYQNKTYSSSHYDADSVKVKDKTLSWTEKYTFTNEGSKFRTDRLAQYEACKANSKAKGPITHFESDFEIKDGKYRRVAIRNFNKSNELICSDKEMGKELDTSWHKIGRRSQMEEMYYHLVTKYKLQDI